jgi:phage repressor protein C with HTH and peptisase S24 domain
MYPTIDDRDLMLVNIANTDIVEGKFYVFSIGDEVFVKRLRRAGGRVLMMSDNRDLFPHDEPVPDDQPFTVHARVEWAGRRM